MYGTTMLMMQWSERSWGPTDHDVGTNSMVGEAFQKVMSIAEGVTARRPAGDPSLVADPSLRTPPDSREAMKLERFLAARAGRSVVHPRRVVCMFMSPPAIRLLGVSMS